MEMLDEECLCCAWVAFSPIAESPEQAGSATPEFMPASTHAKTSNAAVTPKQELPEPLPASTSARTDNPTATPKQELPEPLPAPTPPETGKMNYIRAALHL